MSDTPRTDAVRKANIGHPLRMTRMIYHAETLERELNQSKLDRLAAQVEADTWGNCAELLAHALWCANNSYAGSPVGQKQIDDALRVFEKLKGTK